MKILKPALIAVSVLLLSAGASYAQVLYGAAYDGPNGPSTLYTIDIGTGAATPIGPIGFERCAAMAYDDVAETLFATCERPDGSDTPVLVNINPATGAGAEVGVIGACDIWQDMSFRNFDNALFSDAFGGCPDFSLVRINTESGAGTITTQITGTSECCGSSLAFSALDILYYLGSDTPGPIGNLYTVNQGTGAASLLTAISFPASLGETPRVNAMDFHPVTGALYGSVVIGGPAYSLPRENFLGVVDIATGNLTVIGPTVEGIDAIAFEAESVDITASIPALSEWGLIAMAVAMAIAGFIVMRRKSAAA